MVELASEDVEDGLSESDNMHINEDVVAKVRENLMSGGLVSEQAASTLGKIECQVGMTCPSQNAFLISFPFADIINGPWYTSV